MPPFLCQEREREIKSSFSGRHKTDTAAQVAVKLSKTGRFSEHQAQRFPPACSKRAEMRLALIWNWAEAVSCQACLMGPLKWDYQARSDGHSSGSAARIPPPNFANNNFAKAPEVSTFFLSRREMTQLCVWRSTYLPAGLLSPLQHTSVLARGSGGRSISAARGSVSSSSRPTQCPTTRGRSTGL